MKSLQKSSPKRQGGLGGISTAFCPERPEGAERQSCSAVRSPHSKTDELERMAIARKPLPEFTPMHETCYYWIMRRLHDSLRDGKIQRDAASKEKHRAVRRYNEFLALYEESRKLYEERQENIRKCELLLNDIVKESDMQNAAVMAFEVIGLLTGDRVFAKTMKGRAECLRWHSSPYVLRTSGDRSGGTETKTEEVQT